ncbi:MAG: hypothetical protein LCH69_08270 [Proteobacteria bacterium]|nr:hypothetical protein [Pseudomonadota bacterium]
MRLAIALVAAFYAPAALAQGGIDFAAMPKGCNWLTKLSDRPDQRETFLGKVKGKYRVKIVDARNGAAISTIDYNAEGLMVRRTWADGRWERFEPYSCFTVPGKCSYTYRNGAGDRVKIDSEVRPAGEGFTSAARPRGGAAYPVEKFTLGPFGLMTSSASANYSTKITGFTGCGPTS